jgi:capsular polysaccharide biosynthesis protein
MMEELNNVVEHENFDEISLEDIWNIIVRRWVVILVLVISSLLVSYLYYDSIVPLYRSDSTLIVQIPSSSSSVGYDTFSNYTASEKWAMTYAEMLRGDPVLKEASNQINYPTFSVQDLRKGLSVSVIKDTMLLKVSFEYENPSYAQKIVNTINSIFIEEVSDMYESKLAESGQQLHLQIEEINNRINLIASQIDNPAITSERRVFLQEDIEAQYRIRSYLMDQLLKMELQQKQLTPTVKVYQEGTTSENPTNKNFMLILAIGIVLGLFLGVLLAFLFEYLDDSIKNEEDLKRLSDKRVLGNIFYFHPEKSKKGRYYSQYGGTDY